jgi:hypothetical protein
MLRSIVVCGPSVCGLEREERFAWQLDKPPGAEIACGQRDHGDAGWHETCFDEVAVCSEKVKRNPRHGPMLAIVDDHAKLEYADVFHRT